MVNVPTGGRKKKLRQSMATTEVTTATQSRPVVATPRTTIKKVIDTVAALVTSSHRR